MIIKKTQAGEGEWACVREDLEWTVEMEDGKVAFLERKFWELLNILDIPSTKWYIGRKELERSEGKLRSLHLAVTGAVKHLYHIQHAI